jgi:hypothetical protein
MMAAVQTFRWPMGGELVGNDAPVPMSSVEHLFDPLKKAAVLIAVGTIVRKIKNDDHELWYGLFYNSEWLGGGSMIA